MKGLLSVVFLLSFLSSFSQAIIDFNGRAHDFGNIKEVNGAVAYNFEFVNTGNAPILVKNVESSCGCTSPEWTKQPVLPGKKGFIKTTFDPKDRPGYFDKTITVYSNARPSVVELKIKGTVEGKTRTILDDYPYELPSGLRLPLEHISLMKVRKGEMKAMSIGVFNNAGKAVAVSFAGLPPHLRMSIEPQQIDNKEKAVIKAAYNSALKGEYGLNKDEVTLIVDGKKYSLPVSIFIEEDFKNVNIATAPLIDADKKYYSFGQTTSGQSASFTYQLKNNGKTPLKIYRIYTNDDRVIAEMTKKDLQPGETAPLIVKTKSGAEVGKVTSLISIISNCPSTSELNLRFYGEIK
ncbi:MAG: DUF1573 domain-containing protein [Odoribacter sp.]